MKEVSVTCTPDYVLRDWQAFRIHGESLHFEGTVYNDRDRFMSPEIVEFDSVAQCGVTRAGEVWQVRAENVTCQDFEDCTWEFLAMMDVPVLEADRVPEPPKLATTGVSMAGTPNDSEPDGLRFHYLLKPCPFCGQVTNKMRTADAPLSASEEGWIWHAGCWIVDGGCGAYVVGTSKQGAIEKWNRRESSANSTSRLHPLSRDTATAVEQHA